MKKTTKFIIGITASILMILILLFLFLNIPLFVALRIQSCITYDEIVGTFGNPDIWFTSSYRNAGYQIYGNWYLSVWFKYSKDDVLILERIEIKEYNTNPYASSRPDFGAVFFEIFCCILFAYRLK